MSLTSLPFAIFLPIVFIIYWVLPQKGRGIFVLLASYFFYMSWNPIYILLILSTTIVSYACAIRIEKSEDKKTKKAFLVLAVIICLGFLVFFKYTYFLWDSISYIFSLISIKLSPLTLKILLPVGISFYTFQTLGYLIDVYNGKVTAEKNIIHFATFVSYFPQLLAGPIGRAQTLLQQIKSDKKFDYDMATYGLKLMAWGFFKKIAIADPCGKYVDAVYESLDKSTGADVIIAVLFFTLQIYCDFSGYSDIAIGTSKLFGIDLSKNFSSPYFATGIKEFWSRWHISLSTWFRDYVYIPLGGNRCKAIKRDRNTLITFFVSGLWHGANWTFALWGMLHGMAQIIENHFFSRKADNKLVKLLKWLTTFAFCNLAWIFFRADTMKDVGAVFALIGQTVMTPATILNRSITAGSKIVFVFAALAVLTVYDYYSLKTDVIQWVSNRKPVIRWILYIGIIWLILLFRLPEQSSEFVYFQF